MNKKILIVCLLTALSAGCDRQGARMDEAAEMCAEAVTVGALQFAEEQCSIALGENNGADLKPEIRSERLYRLGRIKRTQAKHPEARELMSQSLAIEETLSGPDSPATGTRLLELALIAAGQKQWEEGVGYLERILPLTTQLNDRDQATLARVLRLYAGKLENMQQAEQAARFRDAHAALQESLQSQEKTASP
jgi:tetratricopeptide (TPR) repeat protein